MRITDLIDIRSIDLNGKAESKAEALNKMVELMMASGKISDKEAYKAGVYKREEESTTGIGDGIAIPHAKSTAVKAPGLAAMVLKDGVDFDSLDGEKVHLIFLIAAPNTEDNVHLDVLSKLSILLMDETFGSRLKNANTKEEFLKVIDEAEKEKNEEKNSNDGALNAGDVKILAVTACPTGIAHTYMAAESLESAAKEKGISIKVETRGSAGAKNVLTKREIEEAACIIVAADTKVPVDRFNGKKVIQCQVSDGIGKADILLEKAVSGNASIFHSEEAASKDNETEEKERVWHKVYKHLMNGVSNMLPFVVGGGIMIAIAFLIDGFYVDLETATDEVKANFGTITEAAAFFKKIGGTAFGFMLPILAGYIAMSIADRPGLVVGFVGGAIAANGKSGFLGALVAGFVAGYLIELLKKLLSRLPKSIEGIKTILLYPLLGVLLIGAIMAFIVEPPVGAINTSLNNALNSMNGTSKLFLGMLVGGMMAVDLGGPVNKAAYVFGTASIAAGNYDIMAAVMIGGMVPPCGIALATLLFKNKFTEEERKSGPVNFIMGLSFITEGAIPYAAADPIRVIPACVVGSALAGALSMLFKCTLMAPHGGVFVFPVMGNAVMYLLALVTGTLASTLLLGILKKNRH